MRALLGILLVLSLFTAGCTTPGDGPGTDTNETDDGTGGSGPNPTPTPTQRTDAPPHPSQQRVDDPDDVDEPGEYALLPRASDHTDEEWEVPEWSVGDRWEYETIIYTEGVAAFSRDMIEYVHGISTVLGVDTYEVTRRHLACEDDGNKRCNTFHNFTQSDLLIIEDNGYIEHNFVFPLKDGKQWVFAAKGGAGQINKVFVEARHDSSYPWPGPTSEVEAWQVVLQYEDTESEQKFWLGEDQKNILRHEVWIEQEGSLTMVLSRTLESYTLA